MFGERQKRRNFGARNILGVVVVAWLNLALQPCAMACPADQVPDCPNCPPGQLQHHDSHDMAADGMPCASSANDCDVLGDLNNNERADQVKLKDLQKDLPASIVPASPVVRVGKTLASTANSLRMSRPPGGLQPLHKLYCVYLK